MRFRLSAARLLGGWVCVWVCVGFATCCPAQAPSSLPTSMLPAGSLPTPDEASQHKGTVIFSRSGEGADAAHVEKSTSPAAETKSDGNPSASSLNPVTPVDSVDSVDPASPTAVESSAAINTERIAITVTAMDLDVRLHTIDQAFAARAHLVVRNDGSLPLPHLLLQLSSSLHWDQIRILNAPGARAIAFTQTRIKSDADHTGALTEARIRLAQPLAPGATLPLDLDYSGHIPQAADRLVAVGTPDRAARLTDWDRIGPEFTGLRGFGNVVWYPVASTPVFLGDGSRLFDEIGAHRQRSSSAHFKLELTVEFQPGHAPNLALINGLPVLLTITNANADAEVSGVAHANFEDRLLGFDEPSLFVAIRSEHTTRNMSLWAREQNETKLKLWLNAASDVSPLLMTWLGKPRSVLTLLDLPEAGDAPFETGAMLAVSLAHQSPAELDALEGMLAHALTHSWIAVHEPSLAGFARPVWLNEGLAQFISTLWIEKQHGRDQALHALESSRPALALAEPESPGAGEGQPLNKAISPIFIRTKAAYVLWMLRDQAGDTPLQAALGNLTEADGTADGATTDRFEKLILKYASAQANANLTRFFADWVNADKGLPDLSIDGVYSSAASTPGSWLVAVDVANAGYAAAEVAVVVRSATNSASDRISVPARGKMAQRILIEGKPIFVQVNDGTVPESEDSIHVKKLN